MSGISKRIKKASRSVTRLINRGLDKIDSRQAKLIKQAYTAGVVLLVLIGLAVGIKKGRSAASIDLPPLAESVNDVFEFDIKEERASDFTSMTDSSLLSEEKTEDRKIPFGESAAFDMEYDSGILDYKPQKAAPSLMLEPEPAEALPPLGRTPSDVKVLKPMETENRGEASAEHSRLDGSGPIADETINEPLKSSGSITNGTELLPLRDFTDVSEGKGN